MEFKEKARAELGRMNVKFEAEAFIGAAKEGDHPVVELFLAAGMAPEARDQEGNTALTAAARAGRREIVRTLLEKGADRFIDVIR